MGWVGLSWVGLGQVRSGWVRSGWVGLRWVGLGWADISHGWVGLGWAGISHGLVGLGKTGQNGDGIRIWMKCTKRRALRLISDQHRRLLPRDVPVLSSRPQARPDPRTCTRPSCSRVSGVSASTDRGSTNTTSRSMSRSRSRPRSRSRSKTNLTLNLPNLPTSHV